MMTPVDMAMRKRGQRGRSKATLDLIATCSEIIEKVQPITVRGVCYRLFVAGYIDSMAVKNTQKVSRLLVQAREEGLIPWEWIVDDSRHTEREPHWLDLKGYAKAIEHSYRRDFWRYQPIRVVVISEKATVSGILRPALEAYGVPFMALHGYNSATKVNELAEEILSDNRQHVFLYVGDYDCSGMHMSEVDLPERLKRYGASEFKLCRIALTEFDIGGGLPSFEAKKTDPRYGWYVENYGDEAWELDAMDPNNLRERVETEIEEYVDAEAWERHKLTETAEKETVKIIATKMTEAVAG
jgi:hypothetical protein